MHAEDLSDTLTASDRWAMPSMADRTELRPMISEPRDRRNVDPRGVWMRQNKRTESLDGRPMHMLRISTMAMNVMGAMFRGER